MEKSSTILLLVLIINSLTLCSSKEIKSNRINRYYIDGKCNLPMKLESEINGYQQTVNKIADEIVNGKFAGDTYKSLLEMTDKFGGRLTGTPNLENAIDYMVNEMKAAGLENVHTESVTVPHWERGYEFAELISPRKAKLNILGLGNSVGTPRGGIIGDVIVVESFDELHQISDEKVQGKIVVFVPEWQGYGPTVRYRSRGATEASKKGAIASLIRSATPFSIGSPHTGMQQYGDGVRKIPTACLTVEDAEMLLRMYRKGEQIQIHLEMEDRNLPPVISRNTIGELTGTVYKNKSVVVTSGHLDSWDVGVGAMDDGGGAFISWKAVQYLKEMGLRPKRTIRSILWTGEEFGMVGSQAYEEQHKANELEEFNFFMESDIGTFEPLGLDFLGNDDAQCIFKAVLNLMTPLNATEFKTPTDGGPDIDLWLSRGFPGASLLNKNERYFWFHHSAGDSILLEDPVNLDKCTALFAATAYVIADLNSDIPKDVHYD